MEIDDFKQAVGKFPTGVTIITTKYQSQYYGFTANSFVSVSLNPALISFCLEKKAHSLTAFQNSEYFIVNILDENQAELAKHFARKGSDKFAETEFVLNEHNIPFISNYVSKLECQKFQSFECGDHIIFIGLVQKVSVNAETNPLIYYAKQFRSLGK